MKKLLLLLLLCVSFSVLADSNFPDNRHIQIEGKGSVSASADWVQLTFDIDSNKDTSCDAKLEVEHRINIFLEALSIFNIKDENVMVSSFSVNADYTYNEDDEEIISGYIASRTITVTVPKAKSLNDFLEFLPVIGVTSVIDYQPMSLENEKYQAMAAKRAIENAKSKGRALAAVFGAKLGKIYSINASEYDSEYEYLSSDDIVHIVKTNSDTENDSTEKYLEETLTYSSTISVVFDLKVK